MKKKTITLLATSAVAAVLAMALAGCGGSQAASEPAEDEAASSPAAAAPAEPAAAPAAEAPAETSAAPAEAAAPADQAAPAADAAAPAAAAAAGAYIGDEAALATALADAGIAQADCTELSVELDLDDAVVHYDVEFKSAGMEYDYDIDATTGEIITSKSEVDD